VTLAGQAVWRLSWPWRRLLAAWDDWQGEWEDEDE
jgi:hypothetical protein